MRTYQKKTAKLIREAQSRYLQYKNEQKVKALEDREAYEKSLLDEITKTRKLLNKFDKLAVLAGIATLVLEPLNEKSLLYFFVYFVDNEAQILLEIALELSLGTENMKLNSTLSEQNFGEILGQLQVVLAMKSALNETYRNPDASDFLNNLIRKVRHENLMLTNKAYEVHLVECYMGIFANSKKRLSESLEITAIELYWVLPMVEYKVKHAKSQGLFDKSRFKVNPTGEVQKVVFNDFAFSISSSSTATVDRGYIKDEKKDKFLVESNGEYYCFTTIPFMHNLISNVIEYFKKHEGGSQSHKIRDKFLENKVHDVFSKIMPQAKWNKNLRFKNRDGELDVLGISEKYIFLIEAKAGELAAPGMRGALNALVSKMKETIGKGSFQAISAEKHVKNGGSFEGLYCDSLIGKKTIKIVVTFETFLELIIDPKGLITNGILPEGSERIWYISLFDLMVVADYIKGSDQFLHYLNCRLSISPNLKFDDELQILRFFLDGGFNNHSYFNGLQINLVSQHHTFDNDYQLKADEFMNLNMEKLVYGFQ